LLSRGVAFTLVCLLGCATGRPGARTPEPDPPKPEVPERQLLLWEVRGGPTPSYLHGTCHLRIPLEQSLPAPYDDKLRSARVLVTEVDLDEVDPLAVMRRMWRKEPALVDEVGPDTWRALTVRLRSVAPASVLAYLRPWGAWSLLLMDGEAIQAGEDTSILDELVSAEADRVKVRRVSLETVDEQLELMESLDEQFVAELQVDHGTAPADGAKPADAATLVLELCATGDESGLLTIVDDPEYQGVWDPLLGVRNRKWLDPIDREIQGGNAFVSVGAMHLIGRHGLVAMLRARGYQITRAKTRAPAWDSSEYEGMGRIPEAPPPAGPGITRPWISLNASMCSPGNPVFDCFFTEAEACVRRLTRDTEWCVQSYADELGAIDKPLDKKVGEAVVACSVTGVLVEAIIQDRPMPPGPCAKMRDEVLEAIPGATRP